MWDANEGADCGGWRSKEIAQEKGTERRHVTLFAGCGPTLQQWIVNGSRRTHDSLREKNDAIAEFDITWGSRGDGWKKFKHLNCMPCRWIYLYSKFGIGKPLITKDKVSGCERDNVKGWLGQRPDTQCEYDKKITLFKNKRKSRPVTRFLDETICAQ